MANTTRQPRRSKKQWQAMIENQAQSGMTITDYCDQHKIPILSFRRWQKNLEQNETATPGPFIELPRSTQTNLGFDSTRRVELDLGNGMRLSIEGV